MVSNRVFMTIGRLGEDSPTPAAGKLTRVSFFELCANWLPPQKVWVRGTMMSSQMGWGALGYANALTLSMNDPVTIGFPIF